MNKKLLQNTMPDESQGRMLLSHNLDVTPDVLPALSRAEFAQVFRLGLQDTPLQCRFIDHPHWIVEILFPTARFTPAQVGELCARSLAAARHPQRLNAAITPEFLVLGGLKTTPPTSDSPDALQPGEWGVDVVETLSRSAFLQSIAWAATIAQKPSDSIFKVEL
jgi:Protein of unknown function (DUF2656)